MFVERTSDCLTITLKTPQEEEADRVSPAPSHRRFGDTLLRQHAGCNQLPGAQDMLLSQSVAKAMCPEAQGPDRT